MEKLVMCVDNKGIITGCLTIGRIYRCDPKIILGFGDNTNTPWEERNVIWIINLDNGQSSHITKSRFIDVPQK
jgi:hypothetical protein